MSKRYISDIMESTLFIGGGSGLTEVDASTLEGVTPREISLGESHVQTHRERVVRDSGLNEPTSLGYDYASLKKKGLLPAIWLSPFSQKQSKIFSVLPTNGDADLDFTRTTSGTTSGTRVNSQGLIEEIAIGVPRLNYPLVDGVVNGCPSYLFEPESTNLVLNSTEGRFIDDSGISYLITSPDGTNTSRTPSPSSNFSRFENNFPSSSFATGDKLTYSWYRKRLSTPTDPVFLGDLEIKSLVNLTLLNGVNSTQIESDINGFDRFQSTVTVDDGSLASRFRAYYGNVIGIGQSSVSYWGHQLEEGSYATSIIPTNGSAITRTAETASRTGLESYINSSEGTLYFKSRAFTSNGYDTRISISDGSLDNRIEFSYGNGSNQVYCLVELGGVSVLYSTTIALSNLDEFKQFAIKWKSGSSAFYINGVDVFNSNTIFTSATMGIIKLSHATGALPFFTETQDLRVYNTALTDLELETLTSFTSFALMAQSLNYTIQ